ncbi:MAG: Uncharacterized protein AWU54_405 [Candidatus Frackibacter sp. T328-2]|nr:MAG: Uncharacterized protein AWU54_405 [Candidatus Frackibacter sp. T328-2]
MVRGYSGYYKDVYLRSSLEFAYAYYLDFIGEEWIYEYMNYDLFNGRVYKPDFFIINYGDIDKIIEVKGETNKEEGKEVKKQFEALYNIPLEIISRKDLIKIYDKSMPISLEDARVMFREEYGATLISDVSGKNNPHYDIPHTEETKAVISEKAKKRWEDEEYREKMKKAFEEREITGGYQKTEREMRVCEVCGKGFEVMITSSYKCCSKKCGSILGAEKARAMKADKKKLERRVIRDSAEDWALENKDVVLNTPYNRISSGLQSLYQLLEDNLDIKDERTVSRAFGVEGRKELLGILKNLVS